ncbi:MAG: ATP-binding protein [Patescibacteria group bacterium]|nr:ATP-binding protein [Patescibacteria group bacterium]
MAIDPQSAILQAEEQRAQAEALFNSIGEGAIATDEFGRITRINPIALDILGYKESELIGEWFPKKIVAINEDDVTVNLIDRPITKAFLTGRSVTDKIFYRKHDGQRFPVMLTVSPILLADRPIGAIEVFRDITLEEEIDRMKSEFISLASHQLRTPLSAIKTYSHMLVDGYMGDVTPAQKKSLRTIIGATNRMNELISTLLNITRIESGTIVINSRMLRVERAAEEVIKELSLAASEKNINLSMTVQGKLATSVKTDNLILKEIISNLVSNAIKYTTEGGAVDISVRGRVKDVLITVTDNGWGIPKESHDQVFSKFFRAQNTVKRETTGTGLGLYLVKGLLERLRGTIWFESEEGKGTKFFFTLPKEQRQRSN